MRFPFLPRSLGRFPRRFLYNGFPPVCKQDTAGIPCFLLSGWPVCQSRLARFLTHLCLAYRPAGPYPLLRARCGTLAQCPDTHRCATRFAMLARTLGKSGRGCGPVDIWHLHILTAALQNPQQTSWQSFAVAGIMREPEIVVRLAVGIIFHSRAVVFPDDRPAAA